MLGQKVRTVFFRKSDWTLVETESDEVVILRGGEPVNGFRWPAEMIEKAVHAFQEVTVQPAGGPQEEQGRGSARH